MASNPPRRKAGSKASTKRTVVKALSCAQVRAAVERMSAPSGTARFAAGKALAVTAEKAPDRVYPYFGQIAALLESGSKVVCWNALQIVGSLAPADVDHRLDGILDGYLAFIRGNNLVSAANAIQGAGKIAQARPELLDQIIPAILGVRRATYKTPECRNVAIGQTLEVLRELGVCARRRADVAAFIRGQTTNSRAAVARLAKQMAAEA